MTTPHPPACNGSAAIRHELGHDLKRLRQARALRLEDVAAHLEVAPSTLSRIETGKAPTRTSYLATILDLYGIEDPAQRKHLTDLARDGRDRPWWTAYASWLPAGTGPYLDLEAAAAHIRSLSACLIPDLLQTSDYAQAAYRAACPGLTTNQAHTLAALPRRRRDHLTPTHSTHLIITETALLQPVAPANVIATQLNRILALAARHAITLQVTPRPVISPPFTVLTFTGPASPAVTCCEGPARQVILTRSAASARAALRTFRALAATAMSPADSADLITSHARQLRTE